MINSRPENPERQPSGALVGALLKSTQTLLAKCLIELYKQAKDPGFRNDLKAEDLYTRYDALDALVGFHESITSKCLAEAEQNLLQFPEDNMDGLDSDQNPWEIQVIETSEIELAEAAAPLVEALEAESPEALQHLQVRIEYLNHSLPDRLNPRGLHPEALFNSFQHAINGLGIKVEGKLILCQCFHAQLSTRLGGFYQKVNKALSDSGILNDEKSLSNALYVKHLEMRGNSASKNKAETTTSSGNGQLSGFEQNNYPGDSSASPQTQLTDAHQSDVALDCADDDRFIHLLLATESPGTGSMLSPYQRAQIIGALSLLQRSYINQKKPPSDDEIKTSLSRILYDSGIFNANDLVQKESPAMDFVSKIFTAISNDATFSDIGKDLIVKLQIPTIKLALLDFDFFQNPVHPARRVLNLLTSLSIDIIDVEDPVFTRLQAIVHSLLNKFDTDILIFERALFEIKKLAPKDNGNTLTQPAIRAQQQPDGRAVRGAVDKVIGANINIDDLPGKFRIFFIEHFIPYLRVILADQGPRSQSWKKAVELLQNIAKVTKVDLVSSAVAGVDDDLTFANIEESLTEIFPSYNDLPELMSELRSWYSSAKVEREKSAVADSSEHSPVLSVEEFCSNQGHGKATGTQSTRSANAPPALPACLKPGTWFEIHQAEGKAKRLLKLSSILEQSDQIVFANRSGEVELTLGLQAFLKDLQVGRSKPINDSNIFDRALNSVISNIRQTQNKRGAA